ncbi:MAG: heavy-metal-associated domain-containing protein [Actinomycetota bacterium]|nr:heavy-metal-associated domain-containing protein [Actinomycetota bacterium]
MSNSTTYRVVGMTCQHCVDAVGRELRQLDGVTEVTVDLVAGGDSAVRIRAAQAPDLEAVRRAVDEAGYALAE